MGRGNVGIVLGAGGAFGWAWHLGVLEGIGQATGVTIDEAGGVVGTSAGAAMAIAAASGKPTEEILDVIVTPPDEATMEEMRQRRAELRSVRRWFRPMAPRLPFRGGAGAMVGLLPAGPFPTSPLRRFPTPDTWPANLLVTAVRLEDGERVVWSAGDGIDLHDAIEASAAVPALFEPKLIGDVRYIDGAVASATSAELLIGRGLDTVVISTPMTRPGRGLVRVRSRRHLRTEIAALEQAGIVVVVIEPTAEVVDLAGGYPRTNHEVGPQVVAIARSLTLDALA